MNNLYNTNVTDLIFCFWKDKRMECLGQYEQITDLVQKADLFNDLYT